MLNLFVSFLLIYLTLILFSYFVGYIFFKVAKASFENIYTDVFIKCTIGISLIVSLYSIINNGYKTIFVAAIPLFFCLILRERSNNSSVQKEKPQNPEKPVSYIIPRIVITSVVIFCVSFFISNRFGLPLWISNANGDYIFYSKISKFLSIQGQENVFHIYNQLLPNYFEGFMPYHYFDLWLNNFLLNFHNFSAFLGYTLLVIPFLIFLIVMGISAILTNYLKSDWRLQAVSLLSFFFFGGVLLPGYNFLPKTEGITNFYSTIQTVPKLYPVYLFLLLFVCSSLLNKKDIAYFSLLFLVIVYSTTLPAVLGGVALLIVLKTIQKNYREALLISGYMFTTLLGIVFVFTINSTSVVLKGNNQYSLGFVINHFNPGDLKTMLNILVGSQYLIGLLYVLPFLFLLISVKNLWKETNLRSIFYALGGIYLTSVLCWIFFFKELNSGQLFTNISLPLLNILSLLVLLSFTYKKNKFSILTFIFIVLVNAGISCYSFSERENNFNANYYSKIAEIISKDNIDNKIGVTLLGVGDYTSIFSYPNTSDLSQNLFIYNDQFQSIPISDYEINLDGADELTKLRAESLTKLTFYRRYLEDKMADKNYKYRDLPKNAFEHQLQYIRENNVKYAFVSKHYPYWNKLTPHIELFVENELNQEKFVIFNLSKAE